MWSRRAPTGYSENDARFYYEREQLPEVQVHIQRMQKKNYIGSQKRLPKQTRNILVRKERNLFKTAGLIWMKRTTTTSIIHGHYRCHVLLCQCRTCVHSHSPSSTTPHIADHDDRWMCQSTHGNDKNEYSSHEQRAFINNKRNKIVRKIQKKIDKHIQKISIPVILHLPFGLPQYSYKTNTFGQKSRTHEICWEHNTFGSSNRVALHLSARPCNP